MTLADALEAVAEGERVMCDLYPAGVVVKLSEGWQAKVRVVFEGNGPEGASYDFTPKPEHESADWRIVKGWA
jgi:hypothetical protein